jgi:hypothetical protein
MPGYPQAQSAEPEGAPAQSSEEASEGEPAAGERGGEEGGEAEEGGEEAPEQEEAEEAPPEESEEAAEAPAEAPAEGGADSFGDFSVKRLALRLPPPVPAKPVTDWSIKWPASVQRGGGLSKKNSLGMGQTSSPSSSGIFPVVLLSIGVLAVGGLVYYLKKVKKT